MTSFQYYPNVSETQPNEAPDLSEAVREAQAMGDWAYRIQLEAGYGEAEAAELYHSAFVETMRALGRDMPCACQFCKGEATVYRWVDPLTAAVEEFVG